MSASFDASTAPAPTAMAEASEVNPEAEPLTLGGALTYTSGNFGTGAFNAFNHYLLPSFLSLLGASPIVINLLSSTSSIEGIVVQPTVGAWSDRGWHGWLGRRRWFVAVFAPIAIAALALTPSLPPVLQAWLGGGATTTLYLAAAGIFLFTLAHTLFYNPYSALLADLTPPQQRGRVNGLFHMLEALGELLVIGLGIVLVKRWGLTAFFPLVAGVLLVCYLPPLLGLREQRALPGVVARKRYTIGDYWAGLRANRQVWLYLATKFFIWFGISAITPNLVLYAEKILNVDSSAALVFPLLLLLTSAVCVVPLGALADRLGIKVVFVAGMLLMAGASAAGIVIHAAALLYPVLIVAGLGYAAQTACAYPLLTRLVASDTIGLYTGLDGALTALAAPLAAVIIGALITFNGYGAMFPVVAAAFLLSLIPLALLDPSRAPRALAERAASEA
ncbi:MAG TPA: MFS transporter [Ktedonobacterales bacterium]|nr:MFS transporter [Ktedonobacterales bacterium]